jgi:DNA-binding Lrp family transcriptional regulator
VVGFVFIKTHSKMEVQAFRELGKIKEITDLSPLFGEYDVIAKVEARDFKTISSIVLNKIRKIKGVEDTLTLPGIKI